MFAKEVAAEQSKLQAVLTGDVVRFNERLKSANVPHVGITTPPK